MSNAEPKEWFDSVVVLPRTKRGSKPPPKERIRSRRPAFSHSFHSPCSWAAPSRWNRMVEGALGPIAGLAGLDHLHQMVAYFLVVFLVDASHLVAAASIPGRKLVDLEMSPLVTA